MFFIIRPPEGDRSAGFYITIRFFGKIRFGDFWICGKCFLDHFENLEFSTKFWIFKFSTNFSYVHLNMDRTIHNFSSSDLYMDRTIHISWHVDVAAGRGGSRGLVGARRGRGGSPGSPGGRQAKAPWAGNQILLPP